MLARGIDLCMLSVVIPAWNEERYVGATVRSIIESADEIGVHHEVTVVDDASDDGTSDAARDAGAQVLRVENRQIAATRNAGGWAARGDLLLFVDADTIVNPASLDEAVEHLAMGAIGGGAPMRFDGQIPRYAKMLTPVANGLYRAVGLMSGAFMYCRRDAFESIGGFDEQMYAAEEADFARRLRKRGRITVVRTPVVTSGRKLRTYPPRVLLGTLLRLAARGKRGLNSRNGLDIWYQDAHEDPGLRHSA